eukprot:12056559-Prorocentrum_lima.AAC.1
MSIVRYHYKGTCHSPIVCVTGRDGTQLPGPAAGFQAALLVHVVGILRSQLEVGHGDVEGGEESRM